MRLIEAIPLRPGVRLALVGAGGKSTGLFTLARQYEGAVWLATSTHLAVEQATQSDRHFILKPGSVDLGGVQASSGITLITGPQVENGRLAGLEPAQLAELARRAGEIPLLIEADGSRRRPLKAPDEHEPAIPEFVDTVAVIAGWKGVGLPLDPGSVHRPDRFGRLAGIASGEVVTMDALAAVLAHPEGGLKNIPPAARKIVLINQCDAAAAAARAANVADQLLKAGFHAVITAHLESVLEQDQVWSVHSRVAGVVLAAGGSERMGEPKQLLPWRGEAFVAAVCRTALLAGLEPVIVVVGYAAGEVQEALAGVPVQLVLNSEWKTGQSSSVKVGLATIPPDSGGAVFLLADQPQVPPELVQAILERYALTQSPVVAPLVDGRRSSPVLFGRETFAAFDDLQGDEGGRQLLSRFPVEYVTWIEPSVGLDVDTAEDYARLLNYED